ncbi:hypothetical protein [Dickeya dianthicola]|uniref:hypothetical protein n=1 Tax=Dickeya dianthicola TaxID=204039 RepID=UPI001869387C|nr:hypothetical protein [Dickeya dianthicola]QOL12806.1 hypothetical protein HGI48_00295 [Dickeya dianthicola]
MPVPLRRGSQNPPGETDRNEKPCLADKSSQKIMIKSYTVLPDCKSTCAEKNATLRRSAQFVIPTFRPYFFIRRVWMETDGTKIRIPATAVK